MIDMKFLSVIRCWALRDQMPIREIARRTGLSQNTIKKYLREGAVDPKFKTLRRQSKLDLCADCLSAWLLAQTRKSRKDLRNVKLLHEDLVSWATIGPTSVSQPLGVLGAQIGTLPSKRRDAAPKCFWCSNPMKPSSSIGAMTGPTSAVNGLNCRRPISSARIVGHS